MTNLVAPHGSDILKPLIIKDECKITNLINVEDLARVVWRVIKDNIKNKHHLEELVQLVIQFYKILENLKKISIFLTFMLQQVRRVFSSKMTPAKYFSCFQVILTSIYATCID